MGFWSGWALFASILLSGPIGFGLAQAMHPMPPWNGSAEFAASFHPIQSLPYLFGFLLIGSAVLLMAAMCHDPRPENRSLALAALVFTAAFAALIGLNYVLQTTYVPHLSRNYGPVSEFGIAAFSMSNPGSLAWALEMWGYAFLGAATLCVAPVFAGNIWAKAARWLLASNGAVSLLGAGLTAWRLEWVLSPAGFWSYVGWNILVLAMAACVAMAFRAAPDN